MRGVSFDRAEIAWEARGEAIWDAMHAEALEDAADDADDAPEADDVVTEADVHPADLDR